MFLSRSDIFTGTIAMLLIAIAAGFIMQSGNAKRIRPSTGRKLLHLIAICTCAWAISRFQNREALAYIFLLFFLLLLLAVNRGFMQVTKQRSYGIALFPLAFFVLLAVPVFPLKHIVFSVLVLGISDAAAGWAGSNFAKKYQLFWKEEKSWLGFYTFWVTTFVLAVFYYRLFSLEGLMLAAGFAIVPALTELFSYRGSDNFSVPLVTAVWAVVFSSLAARGVNPFFLLCFFALLALLAATTVHKKWLTETGAAAAMWMGCIFFATGGWQAFVAPVIFLVSGSLLSKLNKNEEETDGRNGVQVFANGIIAAVCLVLYSLYAQPVFLTAAIASFSISMADSASSEAGRYHAGKTVDIIGFRHIERGLSGGISVVGTAAGLAGALLLAVLAGYVCNFDTPLILVITLAGFCGMLADSVMGSLLQAKFRTVAGHITERPVPGAVLVKGFAWCNNDMVNILANLLITAAIILLFFITGYTPEQ
jgi:uncharacterized protein (TIGR00297 family)